MLTITLGVDTLYLKNEFGCGIKCGNHSSVVILRHFNITVDAFCQYITHFNGLSAHEIFNKHGNKYIIDSVLCDTKK